MTTLALRESQQSTSRPAGTWKLEPGRALTLHPTDAGELRVARGRLWATLDGPHSGPLRGFGDLVVEPGAVLKLRAGQRVVIEPVDQGEPAYFAWELAVEPRVVPCWEPVLQSWRELRAALAQAGHAMAGLASGLAAVGVASLPRRMPGSRLAA